MSRNVFKNIKPDIELLRKIQARGFTKEQFEADPNRFDKHVVSYEELFRDDGDYTIRASFKRPDSMIDGMTFIIDRGTLIVLGDLYNAFYVWSGNNKIGFFSDLSPEYFCEKFTSFGGRDTSHYYDPCAAKEDYLECVANSKITHEGTWDEEELQEEINNIPFDDENDFKQWVFNNDCDNVLGMSDEEGYLSTCGLRRSPFCQFHYLGISVVANVIGRLLREKKMTGNIDDFDNKYTCNSKYNTNEIEASKLLEELENE